MRIDIATLFTQMCGSVLNESIVGRGIRNGFIEVHTHDIRKYTENKHRRVDDKPYGGGTGMLMQAQPVYDCISAIKSQGEGKTYQKAFSAGKVPCGADFSGLPVIPDRQLQTCAFSIR